MNSKFTTTIFIFALVISSLFVSKVALASATLSAGDFTVWNNGGIKGYDAGFSLSGGTFNNAKSIVIKLYSGSTLLQTNTALPNKIQGSSFLTPFDVFGTFNYTNDGYFINERSSEYGKNSIATKVVATVTLSDGTVLTATNTNLTGDTKTIGLTNGQVLGVNSFNFTQLMKLGSKSSEVKELQKFLNNSGYIVSESGAGAIGSETDYFGTKTKNAVMKFQSAKGLKADGVVGPATRAELNK